MPNLDELTHDMDFTIGGETFHVHDVAPDVLMTLESVQADEVKNEDGEAKDTVEESVMDRIDTQILAFLNGDADSVERWRALRARTENVVPLWKIIEMRELLWATQSERPTMPPSLSVAGRGKTAPTSRGA